MMNTRRSYKRKNFCVFKPCVKEGRNKLVPEMNGKMQSIPMRLCYVNRDFIKWSLSMYPCKFIFFEILKLLLAFCQNQHTIDNVYMFDKNCNLKCKVCANAEEPGCFFEMDTKNVYETRYIFYCQF